MNFRFADRLFSIDHASIGSRRSGSFSAAYETEAEAIQDACNVLGPAFFAHWAPHAKEGETMNLYAGVFLTCQGQVCEYGGAGRVGYGKPQCRRQDGLERMPAGSYGSVTVCEQHRDVGKPLVADQLAAESANGHALAQMLKDERAMMRG